MRLIIKLLLLLCLMPVGALSQERVRSVMVGPRGDQTRIVIALIEPNDKGYKMQSMIIDIAPIKNRNEMPTSAQVDLTSTDRFLSTGQKDQKILLLRWKKAGEIELKCEGKWEKQDKNAAIDKIMETIKAVIGAVPLDTKKTTEVTLPTEIEEQVTSLLNALHTEEFPCVRNAK
jgi:hypothetical protein